MRLGANGLRQVKTTDLQDLLRVVHRGELECPITQIGLGTVGLLRIADELGHLRDLDTQAVKAVLIAVLAERRR
jgi:hypothetical protein